MLGYRVTVCDARAVFATRQRFPAADEVVVDWPHRLLERVGTALAPRDAVCVLTHDPKFDVPAIHGALATAVGYIGAMGSRATHAERLRAAGEVGVDATPTWTGSCRPSGSISAPAPPRRRPSSICAEIIARRTGRQAPSLRDSEGAIHK